MLTFDSHWKRVHYKLLKGPNHNSYGCLNDPYLVWGQDSSPEMVQSPQKKLESLVLSVLESSVLPRVVVEQSEQVDHAVEEGHTACAKAGRSGNK